MSAASPNRPLRPGSANLGVLCLLAALAACGGGGGSPAPVAGSPSPSPTPSPAPAPTPAPAPAPAPSPSLPAVDTSPVAQADPGSPLEAGWEYGATMEVFVRSYADSDGDGVGDLRGLIARLDYLKDLGVRSLWLLPVTRSQDGDHGYAVADYRAIEPAFGSLADFDELLKQAHARGIGVTVDYVMNHSAGTHPAFVNARDGAGNPFRDWYVWANPAPSGWSVFGSNPWRSTANGAYYAPFWDQMPDWNLLNPAVVAFHKDNQRFWLNRGVDGFRFDAVGNLVENGPAAWLDQPRNYTLMQEMQSLAASYSRRAIVCEAPDDPRGFGSAQGCGSAFAFGLQGQILNAARGQASAIQAVSDYFKAAPASMATFLSNHDSFAGQRPWDQLGGNLAQLKLAAATLLLLPGRPFVYYGEEVGMGGAATLSDDGRLRSPMSWSGSAANGGFTTGTPYRALAGNVQAQNVQAQAADPASLLAHYKALMALRNATPAIARGSYDAAFANGQVMGFQRTLGVERVVVLLNYGNAGTTVEVASLPAGAALVNAWPAGAAGTSADATGRARIDLPGQSVRVLRVNP